MSRAEFISLFTYHFDTNQRRIWARGNHGGNRTPVCAPVCHPLFTFHLSLSHFSLPHTTNFANSPKFPLTSILRTDNIHLVAKTRTPPSEWQRTSEMNRQPNIKGLIFIPSAPSQLNRDDYNTQTITLSAWERTGAFGHRFYH